MPFKNGRWVADDATLARDAVDYNRFRIGGGEDALSRGFSVGADGKTANTDFNRTAFDSQPNLAGNLKTGAQVVGALSGLAGAYTGLKSLGLAKKQFGFQKAAANRDIANQAKLINEGRLNAANVGLSLAGGTISGAEKAKERERVKAGNVDGSAIG